MKYFKKHLSNVYFQIHYEVIYSTSLNFSYLKKYFKIRQNHFLYDYLIIDTFDAPYLIIK